MCIMDKFIGTESRLVVLPRAGEVGGGTRYVVIDMECLLGMMKMF